MLFYIAFAVFCTGAAFLITLSEIRANERQQIREYSAAAKAPYGGESYRGHWGYHQNYHTVAGLRRRYVHGQLTLEEFEAKLPAVLEHEQADEALADEISLDNLSETK